MSKQPVFGPKKLPRNILSGFMGQFFSLAIAFVTTPILVHGLSASNYGLWNVAMAVGSWVGFINMVCSTSTIRFVGQALGKTSTQEISEATEAMRRWSLVLGALCCLTLALLTPWLSQNVLHLEPAQRSWAPKVLLLQAVFILFQVLTAVETGVIAADQRLDIVQLIRTGGAALQSVGAAGMVLLGQGVIAVAWWVSMMQALEWIATGVVARKLHPVAAIPQTADMLLWGKKLFSFGAPLVAGYFAAQLFLPASRILLGILRPVAEVTHFAIPLALAINVKAISTHVASALFPAMAEQAGKKDFKSLRALYLKGLRWSWLAIVPPAGLAIALGGAFVSLWVGQEFGDAVAPIMPALVVGVNLYYFSAMPELAAQGMGRPGRWAVIIILAGLSNIAFGSWLITQRGVQGASEALVISGALLTGSLFVWMARVLGVTLGDYVRAFDLRVVAVTCVTASAASYFARNFSMTLGSIILLGVLALSVIGLLMPVWLPKDERKWVVDRLTGAQV